MDFRILGPLEVADGDSLVALPGAKQRALLAMLLLRANEVVSADRLIDELWGDEPPATAATALQVASRSCARRSGRGGAVLVTRPPGYVLRVEPRAARLHRFERLVEEARRRGGRPVAAAKLREALALWRGPPLADLTYESFAQAAIARLEELRLAALEKRIEAELALGRHADLVAELEALVAEHPLRERAARAADARAVPLRPAGRRAGGLPARRGATLVEELGIEPGPPLRELQQAILRQDPSLELARAPLPEPSLLVVPLTESSHRGAARARGAAGQATPRSGRSQG